MATPFEEPEGKVLSLGRGDRDRPTRRWTRATLVARLLLGLVFAVFALSTITATGIFRADVVTYHLLPPALVGPVAGALPWLEALVALYLLAGLFLRVVAVAATALLLPRIGALTIDLAHGHTAHGRGGLLGVGPISSLPPVQWLAGGAAVTWFDVGCDLLFVALAGVIYWGDWRTFSLDGVFFGGVPATIADDVDPWWGDTSHALIPFRPKEREAWRTATRARTDDHDHG